MKYNIAIIGTFDYENFGDLMFPIVFKKQIEKRIELDNLFLFSPNQCQMPLNPEKTQVYSIDKLEQIHNEYGLNAIVFGGGDLARLDNAFAPQENYIPENTSFDLMVYSAVIANKYNIPCLWNCPGVPFEFSTSEQKIVSVLLDDFVDYVAVRDARSAEILKSCGCHSEVKVSPDTVLSIGTLIDKNENGVFDSLCSEYDFLDDGYMVYQMSINKDIINDFDRFKADLCKQLSDLSENTKNKIVFLPIGNVHNDEKNISYLLSEFKNENFFTFNRKLNIYETNAILANATVFIGTSLHGNIVSNSYGVPSIGLDLYDFVKLKNYFKLFNRSEYCITDINNICKAYDKITQSDAIRVLQDAVDNIALHFDLIADAIKNNSHKSGDVKSLLNICFEHNTMLRTNNVTIYYDYGDGFSSENSVNYTLSNMSQDFKFTIDKLDNVKKVRIDPADESFCVLSNLSIKAGENDVDYYGNFSNAITTDELLFFFTKDPKIIFDVNGAKEIVVEFNVKALFVPNNKEDVVAAVEQMLEKIDEISVDKYNFAQQQQAIVQEQENELKVKEAKIQEQQAIINNQQAVLANKNAIIANNYVLYNNLNALYVDIANSFYWRITAIPRRITHKIKTVISKHKKLMLLSVYAKGFLRGGFKEGKRRVISYKSFIANNKPQDSRDLFKISDEQRKFEERYSFKKSPKISILVPLYNTPDNFLKEMIDSVKGQTYKNWELCLADGSDAEHNNVQKYCVALAKKDSRIKYVKLAENKGISENTNECLKLSTGDYISLFDHDDLLHPSVLFEYVREINDSEADFIYCDELTFTEENDEVNIVLKHHKPEFSPDTLRSYNYICHFTCFSRKLYEMVGGFNKEYDGSQDYDLILRLTEKAKKIVRIPKLLYFWRSHKLSVASATEAKPYVVNAAERALAAHLERQNIKGTIKNATVPTTYKIDYEIIGNPLVSIIIPTKDHIDDLDVCLRSIYSKSTYENFEIVVVENNSTEAETFEYYKDIQKKHDNLRVVFWEEKVFNYSAINNFGAKFVSGEYILLLNNDIEVITPDWIEEMLMFAQRKDVGAVGAKLYYPDDTIQHAGVIVGLGGVAGHSHKYFDRKNPGYMARTVIAQNLSACTAACLLIRRDVFDEVDGIDEKFAVAFNDIDLCMKIRDAGYLIVFTPYAEFYHYESKSRGLENSPEKAERFNGEIRRFKSKWGKQLEKGDPYYNPNLTLDREDFSFSTSNEQ